MLREGLTPVQKKTKKIDIKKILIEYLYILAGSFILAFAITYFLNPIKISTGGVAGVGTVLYYIANIPLSVTTLLINAVLFVFGYKTLRSGAVLKTVAGILFLSAALAITPVFGEYKADILICSIFGGILVGLGVGLVVYKDGSTGGSDFAALIFHKLFPHISVATFILLIDSAVIIASGVVFKDYTIMFYSVLSLYISSKVTDWVLVNGDHAKSVYIISKKHEEIASIVMKDMVRGVTGIYSKGFYKNEDNTMLMCIVRNKELPRLLSLVKEIDEAAFTIVSDVMEVRGEGFKELDN